jgi:4-alpha-glucanotransferase
MHAIEGIFGYFTPAISLGKIDFENAGLHFNEPRLCEPFITDEILYQIFGDQLHWVKENIILNGHFLPSLNTQRKLESYFIEHHLDHQIKLKLFELLSNVILLRDDNNSSQFHFRINMQDTTSFQHLSDIEKRILNQLYVNYFFEKQNDLWYQVAQQKLDAIQQSSDMMICAEDLGMVPDMVEGVLKSREMLALQVQRMPKTSSDSFSHPMNAPYLSVVTPSTHDMSTIRQWWEEDTNVTQDFYNHQLVQKGKAPYFCEPSICYEIIKQHMQSPAMWSVFLLQDLMSITEVTRRIIPAEERINNPADPNHYWNYRMHVTLEFLMNQSELNTAIHTLIKSSARV